MTQEVPTPKQRMLNAYRGIVSDRRPVAPEFWYYYPAKVLGVDLIRFQLEVPFWQALQTTFRKFACEGWGVAFPAADNPGLPRTVQMVKVSETRWRRETTVRRGNRAFVSVEVFDVAEPSWVVQYPVQDPADVPAFLDALLNPAGAYDFSSAVDAWKKVGEDYLLELWLGVPFFDFVACATMGFEQTLEYFLAEEPVVLERFRERYIEFQIEQVRRACRETPFESFCLGCAYSCNSLIGPRLWRQWDKPVIRAVAEELHRRGRLLHIHFHGRCIETAADFAQMGIDCVCPFERPPGGDVDGAEGLQRVRELLAGKVTMNGNVHTIETLIRGTPDGVRNEVRQIAQAFAQEPRLIIGTGDQVGRETPEENLLAMIDEAKRSR